VIQGNDLAENNLGSKNPRVAAILSGQFPILEANHDMSGNEPSTILKKRRENKDYVPRAKKANFREN